MKPLLFLCVVSGIAFTLLIAGHAPSSSDQAAQQPRIEVNDANVEATYSNFSRVTGSPEELILDFGLNTNPTGIPDRPIQIKHRIAMNYYTAKRVLAALQMSIQRHEEAFGPIEVDIQKRLKNRPKPAPEATSFESSGGEGTMP